MTWSDGQPATAEDARWTLQYYLDAQARDKSLGYGVPRPVRHERGDHQGRGDGRHHPDRHHQPEERPDPADVPADPAQARLAGHPGRQGRRLRQQAAGRRDRAVPGRRMDQRPVRPARPQREVLGREGCRRRDRLPVLPRRHERDGRRLQERRARLHPQPDRAPVRPAQDAPQRGRDQRRGQRLHPDQLQLLRQGHPGRRRIDEGAPRPGVPRRARLRHRPRRADHPRPQRVRDARARPRCRPGSAHGTPSPPTSASSTWPWPRRSSRKPVTRSATACATTRRTSRSS